MYRFCGDTRPYFKGYIYDGLFLHNYFGGVYVTTWSLDVEEAFYILLPVFFIVAIRFKKLRQSTLVITYLLLILIGVIGRIAANTSYPEYSFLKHYSQTHFRLDALFFGVVLSYFYHYNKSILMNNLIRYRRITISICMLILLPNFVFTREHNNWLSIVMLAINPIAFGLLMALAIEMKPAFLKSKWLNIAGVNSYAIYLWHPFINLYAMRILAYNVTPINFVAYILVYLILSVAIGALATKLIEKPMLNFRDKHFSKKTLPA
jgi:peptidoglycan/LPS O-acetylase OafA/YrhL